MKNFGIYEVSLTTGENLAKVVMDGLQRLNLPITKHIMGPQIRLANTMEHMPL